MLVLVLSSCEGGCLPLICHYLMLPSFGPRLQTHLHRYPPPAPSPPHPLPHLFPGHFFAEPVEGGRLGELSAF